VDRFARVVLGYHGCPPPFAETILRGDVSVDEWQPSQNSYDWLGHGIYFWEYGPERASKWGGGGVVGALIQLGHCLDLTDIRYTEQLRLTYRELRRTSKQQSLVLPKNQGKRRDLDCLVINRLRPSQRETEDGPFQTARCPFLEGVPAFPGSGIRRESHVQLVVFDHRCILGVFRPRT
jgi:hypothetical protein